MVSLAQCGEFALIKQIKSLCDTSQHRVIIGIGDDAAVVDAIGPAAILSADMLVENEDFSLAWAKGKDIGHKVIDK